METLNLKNYKLLCTEKEVLVTLTFPYYQYIEQHISCLEIANQILKKEYTTGVASLDTHFVRSALTNNIAPTLCNVNLRLLLIGNLIHSQSGYCNYSFSELYKIALSNKGLITGKVTDTTSYIYPAVINNLSKPFKFNILTELDPNNFTSFIKTHTKKPIRAWTRKDNSTHATGLFYDGREVYIFDTASRERNNLTIPIDTKVLFGRTIEHLEVIV